MDQLTEAERKAAMVAYRDRYKGAIADLKPGLEGLYLRGFSLAVCLVPNDNAGPILPLWPIGEQPIMAETLPAEEPPAPEAPPAEEPPAPTNRLTAHLKANGVDRGDGR